MDSVTPTFFVKFMSGTLKESVPNFRKIHEVGIAVQATMYITCFLLSFLQSPELVARLERLQAEQEQREYQKMVRNVDSNVSVHF